MSEIDPFAAPAAAPVAQPAVATEAPAKKKKTPSNSVLTPLEAVKRIDRIFKRLPSDAARAAVTALMAESAKSAG